MRILACLALLSFSASGVAADPIADRQALMKERGDLMRVLVPVMRGQQPFDAATVLDTLEKMNANAQAATDVDALWPAGSETGGGTESAPAIWADRDGFTAAAHKYAADASAAAEAAPQDLEAFRGAFAPVAANCGACHEAYRL